MAADTFDLMAYLEDVELLYDGPTVPEEAELEGPARPILLEQAPPTPQHPYPPLRQRHQRQLQRQLRLQLRQSQSL